MTNASGSNGSRPASRSTTPTDFAGSIEFMNAFYLGLVFPSPGQVIDIFRFSERVLATAGFPALAALVAVLRFWPRDRAPTHSS